MNQYTKAWNVAAAYHQHQTYGDLRLPCLTHTGDVVLETISILSPDRDRDLAINVAILHDVIEDSEVNYDFLVRMFGQPIADGVLALTKNSRLEGKSNQLTDSIDRILTQSPEIGIVKMADRISNLGQIPPRNWKLKKIESYINQSLDLHDRLQHLDSDASDRLLRQIEWYRSVATS